MNDDLRMRALSQAMARTSDPDELARLMHELDRLIDNQTRRARSLPIVERR